jgi:hypothetical protein
MEGVDLVASSASVMRQPIRRRKGVMRRKRINF